MSKMTLTKTLPIILIIFIFANNGGYCIWPPPYKVNLEHEEIFVINEPLETKEIQDVYDEEIVNEKDSESLKLDSIQSKFYRLHNSFKLKKENIYDVKFERKKRVYEDSYPDHEEPFQAGFLNQKGGLLEGDLQKREGDNNNKSDESYDYKDLKKEFEANVAKEKKSNESWTYTEPTEINAPKGLMKTLISPSENSTLNCSESRKLGLELVQCLISDLGKPKMRSKALDKLLRVFIVIIFVYLVIAIPLWCQYGWCCCYCRCKFCRPLEEIEEVKKFFVENPLGVYIDKEGQRHEYKPSVYEKYSHKKLSQALQSL